MSKLTIIGLGLVGNSIGMGVKQSVGGSHQVVGFDPDRSLEEAALRRFFSVDAIAPDLESAVRDSQLVIIATPASAMREVLAAIAPFLDEATTVTDTLSVKEPVMAWAGELLNGRASFVGGHPLSKSVDLESASPDDLPVPDLFAKAPYCIMPLPSASSDALNSVIALAEMLGARPLFMDPHEHDSFFAAVSHLPVLASAALLRVTSGSPSWDDIGALAQGQFGSVTEPLTADPAALRDALMASRHTILHWIDQYQLVLQDLRDLLAQGNDDALLTILQNAHAARVGWLNPDEAAEDQNNPFVSRRVQQNAQLRADLQQAIEDTRPGNRMLGDYLKGKVFRKREK